MPLVVACPSCSSKLKAPDNLIGKKVKCPKCATLFVVEAEEPEEPVMAELVEGPPQARSARQRPARAEADEEPFDYDDAAADDEYEERPPRRRRPATDEDEEYEDEDDDRPRRRRHLAGLSNDYSIDLGEWFRYAGSHYSTVLGPMVGYALIYWLLSLGSGLPFGIGLLYSLLVLPPLWAGFTVVSLAQLKGKPWAFGDFFSGFSWYGGIIVCQLLMYGLALIPVVSLIVAVFVLGGVAIAVGPGPMPALALVMLALFLCTLPVFLYVGVRALFFAVPAIIDRGCGPVEAIQASWTISRGHFWGLFGVLVVMWLLNLLGVLACGIGLLFTTPYVSLAQTAGYLLIAGTRGPLERPRY